MIWIDITDSIDLVSLGEHYFPYENVTIGNKYKNSLVIKDYEMDNTSIRLKLTNKDLYLIADNFLKLNGKKIKGRIKLKVGDKINLGQTTMHISKFDCTLISSSEEYYSKLEELSKDDPTSYAVIEFFESEYARKLGTINDLEE